MANHIEKTNRLYYKFMSLKSEPITVQIQEKSPWEESSIKIYHSPNTFETGNDGLKFKSKQGLRDYIDMLEAFYQKYSDELAIVKLKKQGKK